MACEAADDAAELKQAVVFDVALPAACRAPSGVWLWRSTSMRLVGLGGHDDPSGDDESDESDGPGEDEGPEEAGDDI